MDTIYNNVLITIDDIYKLIEIKLKNETIITRQHDDEYRNLSIIYNKLCSIKYIIEMKEMTKYNIN